MSTVFFTLYEHEYHRGVATLINSLISCGYTQKIVVGFKGSMPPWLSQLKQIGEHSYILGEVEIHFWPISCERHLGYHKPFFALDIFQHFSDLGDLFYADPDIVMLAPWCFFDNWITCGVALVEDCTFSEIAEKHPWREYWLSLGKACGQSLRDSIIVDYPNSGFFALRKGQSEFLENWARVTMEFERVGGNTRNFRLSMRHEAVVTDQDLLSAALMYFHGDVSLLDANAMGFKNYPFIMSHAVESPKPWGKCYVWRSLLGEKPTQAAKLWFKNSNGPLLPYSYLHRNLIKLDLLLATSLSRVFRR